MAAVGAHQNPKWEGKLGKVFKNGVTKDQVWPLLEDFCSSDKWNPYVDTCYKVEGLMGQPGLVRYCGGGANSSGGGTSGEADSNVGWCHEKLLSIDGVEKCMSYEVLENNVGIKSYVATLKVVEIMNEEKKGCQIEWSFVADPVLGFSYEAWFGFLDSTLQAMVERMEHALMSSVPI